MERKGFIYQCLTIVVWSVLEVSWLGQYQGWPRDDQHRNLNMNNKDQLVGQCQGWPCLPAWGGVYWGPKLFRPQAFTAYTFFDDNDDDNDSFRNQFWVRLPTHKSVHFSKVSNLMQLINVSCGLISIFLLHTHPVAICMMHFKSGSQECSHLLNVDKH